MKPLSIVVVQRTDGFAFRNVDGPLKKQQFNTVLHDYIQRITVARVLLC